MKLESKVAIGNITLVDPETKNIVINFLHLPEGISEELPFVEITYSKISENGKPGNWYNVPNASKTNTN